MKTWEIANHPALTDTQNYHHFLCFVDSSWCRLCCTTVLDTDYGACARENWNCFSHFMAVKPSVKLASLFVVCSSDPILNVVNAVAMGPLGGGVQSGRFHSFSGKDWISNFCSACPVAGQTGFHKRSPGVTVVNIFHETFLAPLTSVLHTTNDFQQV